MNGFQNYVGELALCRLACITGSVELARVPGTGAAGGTAFGAMLALGAQLVSGAGFVAAATGLAARVSHARAVLVGEGKLDRQTLQGKGPAYMARLAHQAGVLTLAIAGQITLSKVELESLGIQHAIALGELAPSIDEAITRPTKYIREAAAMLTPHLRLSAKRVVQGLSMQPVDR